MENAPFEVGAPVEVGEPTAVELAMAAHDASLDHLIKLVEDGAMGDHDDVGFVAVMQHLERQRNRTWLIDHRMIRDAEQRRLPDTYCQPNLARVLVKALRVSPAEAGRRVRAAEQVGERASTTGLPLPALRPALAAAQRAGEASAEQVDVCLRGLDKVDHRGFDPADLDAADDLFAEFCAKFPPPELRDLVTRVVDRIDPDGTRPDDELERDRRHLAFRKTRDGMWKIEGLLTGALGAKLSAVLGPLAAPRPPTPVDDGGPQDGSADTGSGAETDDRRPGQRHHDALEEVCDRLLDAGTLPDSGGTAATVIVTIPLDDLVDRDGSGVTSDGTRLSAEQIIRDLAGEALLHPAVVDAKGCVLWLGRTSRLASRAQTTALYARDGGCSFPGCSHPPEWCERHHVVAWIDGGMTDLDNLTLLCRFHHHQFLAHRWTCRMIDGLPHWIPPAWMDRAQRPRLNARIAARNLRC